MVGWWLIGGWVVVDWEGVVVGWIDELLLMVGLVGCLLIVGWVVDG